jgi:hypothetical protein
MRFGSMRLRVGIVAEAQGLDAARPAAETHEAPKGGKG